MEPTNFEDSVREKMQERQLQPSADAWDRLEARLGKERSPRVGRRTWYAVAASLVGILIVTSVFFNNEDNKGVVVEEAVIPGDESVITDETKTIAEEAIANQEVVLSEDDNSEKQLQQLVVTKKVEVKNTIKPTTEDKVVAMVDPPKTETKTEINLDVPNAAEIDPATFVENKVREVVAQVQNQVEANETVSAEEIDALLLKAQEEISKQRILNSNNRKVDAAALLSDVEFELERGFRDRVFDALGESFNKIRTAVAERNN